MQINLFDIRLKEYINKLGWVLLVIVIFFFKCSDNSNSEIKNTTIVKKEIKTIEKKKEVFVDSFKKQRVALAKSNEILNKNINTLKKEIAILKSKKHNISKDVEGLVNYYNDRYKTDKNIVVDNKVGLTEETAYDVSFELEESDNLILINEKQNKIINDQDSINKNLISENKGWISLNELTKKELDATKDYSKILEKDNKKLKNKNRLDTYLLKPLIVAASFYAGYKIAQ